MNKKLLFILVFLVAGCGATVGAALTVLIAQEYRADHDGPFELIVRNVSAGPDAMGEVRVINDTGCAVDLTNIGSGYANPQDTTVSPNEPALITESTCAGLLLKTNRGPVRLHTLETAACPAPTPRSGVSLCTDSSGSLWATTANGIQTRVAQ